MGHTFVFGKTGKNKKNREKQCKLTVLGFYRFSWFLSVFQKQLSIHTKSCRTQISEE